MVQCLKCLKYHRTSIIIYDLFHSENGFHVWILFSFKDLIKISFQSSFPSLYKYKCMYNACEHNQYQVGQRNFQRKSDFFAVFRQIFRLPGMSFFTTKGRRSGRIALPKRHLSFFTTKVRRSGRFSLPIQHLSIFTAEVRRSGRFLLPPVNMQ